MNRIIHEVPAKLSEERLLRAQKIFQEMSGRSMSTKETEAILKKLDMLGFAMGKAMEMQARKSINSKK